MSIYSRCNHPLIVNTPQLHIIEGMYPYNTFGYRDVGAVTRTFLEYECDNFPADTRVIAVSQHNGRGHLWGVVLLQYPFWETEWHLLGQFGHESLTRRRVGWRHLLLVQRGVVPTDMRDNRDNRLLAHPKRLGDILSQRIAA